MERHLGFDFNETGPVNDHEYKNALCLYFYKHSAQKRAARFVTGNYKHETGSMTGKETVKIEIPQEKEERQ